MNKSYSHLQKNKEVFTIYDLFLFFFVLLPLFLFFRIFLNILIALVICDKKELKEATAEMKKKKKKYF